MNEQYRQPGEPVMRLNFGNGEIFNATPANTAAYLYSDGLMGYNHIESVLSVTEDGARHVMCFFPDHDQYQAMGVFITNNDYPIYMNVREVEDYVLDAWIDWNDRKNATADKPTEAIPLPAPANYTPEPQEELVAFDPLELAGLQAVRGAHEAELARIASLPMDERSVCLRALEAAREEWLSWHIEDYRAEHRSRESRLEAARRLIPIDGLLDQLYKLDHPEEA
jgi:hypothetical protein